jgi:uncharacterized UBP type Zn finger protein
MVDKVDMGRALGKYITDGNIDKAMEIIRQLNKMDVEIVFNVTQKANDPNVEIPYQPGPEPPKKPSSGKEQLIQQLCDIGVPLEQAEYAAARTSSVEAAFNLLYNG